MVKFVLLQQTETLLEEWVQEALKFILQTQLLQLLLQSLDISQTQEVYNNMITPFEIPCVILSGGKSSRMGEDKSLLPFSSSKTLIEYQYKRLKPYFKMFIFLLKLINLIFEKRIFLI